MGQRGGEESSSKQRTGMTVVVIGSLGELVKKIVELQIRITEDPSNREAMLEEASLQQLLGEWPVSDKDKADLLYLGMKMSITKHKASELEVRKLLKEKEETEDPAIAYWFYQAAVNLMKYTDEVRHQIAELNKLSYGVGKASSIPLEAELIIARVG